MPRSEQARVWQQEVDWVFHAAGRVMSHPQVEAEVRRLRVAGRVFVDTVPARVPALPNPCDF